MTTTLPAPLIRQSENDLAYATDPRRVPAALPDPGLTVVVGTAPTLRRALSLVRPGPVLVLVPVPHDPVAATAMLAPGHAVAAFTAYDVDRIRDSRAEALERAIEVTTAAGFTVHAAETVPRDAVRARLRFLRGEDLRCVVAGTDTPREARALARAAAAPVLAVPSDPAHADGPAVIDAADAARTLPAIARALATDDVAAVAGYEAADAGTLARTTAHPLLLPRLEDVAAQRRWEGLDAAQHRAECATAIAREHGFRAGAIEEVVVAQPDAVLATARERDGLPAIADPGGWRAPRLLRDALRGRRPVLLVPSA